MIVWIICALIIYVVSALISREAFIAMLCWKGYWISVFPILNSIVAIGYILYYTTATIYTSLLELIETLKRGESLKLWLNPNIGK